MNTIKLWINRDTGKEPIIWPMNERDLPAFKEAAKGKEVVSEKEFHDDVRAWLFRQGFEAIELNEVVV